MTTRRTALTGLCITLASLAGCLGDDTNPFGDAAEGDLDERSEAVSSYDDAIDDWNEATETRNRGIEMFNAEAYAEAADAFEAAIDGYTDADETFTDVRDQVRETGRDAAIAICSDAVENTRLQLEATEAAYEGAIAGRDGEPAGTINEHIRTFQDLVEEAEAYPLQDANALVNALDLDQ